MPTLYVTAPPESAEALASTLVEERLAAGVNRVDCDSTYRWAGEVRDEPEVLLLVKTTDEAVERCADRIEREHPYEVPCVERVDEEVLLPAFADWREESVDVGAGDAPGPTER